MMGKAQLKRVSFVKTLDRKEGVSKSLLTLGVNPAEGKHVLIKPNFNTADPVPGSTDNETLLVLVDELWAMGARSIAVGDRSYPVTKEVMAQKGIVPLLEKKGVKVLDFDALSEKDWVHVKPPQSHWPDGFRVARPVLEAECLVSTCCLKTHQYGGVFTLSLKLHVGVVPTSRHGFPYMTQLHQSPAQQEMIAEINVPFSPDLVVLDGIEAFVDGGPMTGKRAKGELFLASTDRVAVDAVGVAALKVLGSNSTIMGRKVFEQRQIARAVDLGLGARSPEEIDLIPSGPESEAYRDAIIEVLKAG
jgi:uncharacterized protein (DUF362 family)